MTLAFYIMFGAVVVMPWAAVIADLPLVRTWWLSRRARRTTRRIWERHPEARPPKANEHLPAPPRNPLDRSGQAIAPPSRDTLTSAQGNPCHQSSSLAFDQGLSATSN